MMGRFSKGLITGGVLGAAAGMLMVPRLDMKNRKRVRRLSRRMFRSF